MRVMQRIVSAALSVLLCVSMVGCEAFQGSGAILGKDKYEGANMLFEYEASDWNVTYRTVDDDNTLIELTSKQGIVLSILSCETETTAPEEIYQDMTAADELLGEVSNTSSANNMGTDGGSASYAHLVKTDYMGNYWTVLYGKNAGDGKILLAASTIYEDPDDEEAAEKSKEAIKSVIDSLEVSETAAVGTITESAFEPDVQSNTLKSYITGGKTDYDYLKESKLMLSDPEALDGFTYVKKVELLDTETNQPFAVYLPVEDEDTLDGYGIFYHAHGIDFSYFTIGEWKNRNTEEIMETWSKTTIKDLKDHSGIYRNIQVEEMVTIEEDLSCYQHIAADELDYNENEYRNDYIGYVGTTENGIGYQFYIDINGMDTDAETNVILDELGQCYGLDLLQYGNSTEDLTNSGKRMDLSQDVYVQMPGEKEITKAEGYNYMGTTELADDDGEIYEVQILMGKNTQQFGNSLDANMHGVRMEVKTEKCYHSVGFAEEAQSKLDAKYERYLTNGRDYKNPVMQEITETREGDGFYGTASADHVASDGSTFPQHVVYVCLPKDEMKYVEIILTLDEADYDSKTNDVLKDIEKAYRVDLSEFYFEP